MSTWCRHVHVRPHYFILTEACSRWLELAYFAGKISKNRLVCKNAVALAYCGSCRLLVMGSWLQLWPARPLPWVENCLATILWVKDFVRDFWDLIKNISQLGFKHIVFNSFTDVNLTQMLRRLPVVAGYYHTSNTFKPSSHCYMTVFLFMSTIPGTSEYTTSSSPEIVTIWM